MTEKVKIAYLIDVIAADTAGTEKQLMGLLRRIDRERFAPHLVCLRTSSWLERHAPPCPVTVLGYEGLLKKSLPAVVRRLAELIDDEGWQIVQTFFQDAIFVGFLGKTLSRRRPLLLVSRRDLGLGDEPWYHHVFRLLRPAVNRRCDGIVANAEAIRVHIAVHERFPAERIKVIPNGVEPPAITGKPPLYEEGPKLRIVISANLKPVKRHDVFLAALAKLQQRLPHLDFQGVLLGDGALLPELVRMAGELGIAGRVRFLGARQDVWDFLAYADIGVLCSDREGLSNAILEYMVCGLPVVATAVGGNGELVDDGNGILVPPGDPEALSAALATLASTPELRRTMGEASLAKIGQCYLWERVMPQWESYYSTLVLNNSAASGRTDRSDRTDLSDPRRPRP